VAADLQVHDEVLYRRVLDGDTDAFEALVSRYHDPLFRFLYRQTGDYAAAEDLLQETFTRLITYHGRLPDHFRAWAYTVASNLARDYFRSAHYRHETKFAEYATKYPAQYAESDNQTADHATDRFYTSAESVPPPAMDDLLILNGQRESVMHALARLTPDHRETVILRFYHDLKLDEIAIVSGVPIGTVKSRLFHALKQLKVLLSSVLAADSNLQ